MLTMVLGGLWHGAAWTFVLWGAFHGAGLCRRARAGRARAARPGWLRWFVTFHLVVFGWILFRSQSLDARRRRSSSRLLAPGPGDAVSRCRSCSRSWSVIGLQLLPERPVERVQVAHRAAASRSLLGAGLAVVIVFVGRDRVRARASPRSSTSASECHARTRRQPDEPLRPHGLRALPRARRRRRACSSRALLLVLFEGDVGPRARASRWTRASARDVVLAVGKPAGCDRRRAAVRAASPTTRPRGSRPTRSSTAAAASRHARAARPAAASRRSPRTRSTRRRSARSRRRAKAAADAAGHRRLAVQPLDASSRGALAGRGVKVVPRPAPRHRHLQDASWSTGASSRPTRCASDQPGRVVVFIGANEGFPMPGAGGKRGRVLRRRLGGGVRQPRAPDDGHLPPGRRGARLLDHRADAARTPSARSDQRASSTRPIEVAAQPWASQVRVIDTVPQSSPRTATATR